MFYNITTPSEHWQRGSSIWQQSKCTSCKAARWRITSSQVPDIFRCFCTLPPVHCNLNFHPRMASLFSGFQCSVFSCHAQSFFRISITFLPRAGFHGWTKLFILTMRRPVRISSYPATRYSRPVESTKHSCIIKLLPKMYFVIL